MTTLALVTPIQFAPALTMPSHYHHQWFLVDTQGHVLSEQDCAGLAQLQLSTRFGQLQVRALGMLCLELMLDVIEDDDEVRRIATDTHGQARAAIDEGELAAVWFEHVLGRPCRLYKKDPGQQHA